MKRFFPWLALGLGLVTGLLLMRFGPLSPQQDIQLPLLTALILNEFAFILNVIAAGMGVRDLLAQGLDLRRILVLLGNLILAVAFLWLGIEMWPGSSSSV